MKNSQTKAEKEMAATARALFRHLPVNITYGESWGKDPYSGHVSGLLKGAPVIEEWESDHLLGARKWRAKSLGLTVRISNVLGEDETRAVLYYLFDLMRKREMVPLCSLIVDESHYGDEADIDSDCTTTLRYKIDLRDKKSIESVISEISRLSHNNFLTYTGTPRPNRPASTQSTINLQREFG